MIVDVDSAAFGCIYSVSTRVAYKPKLAKKTFLFAKENVMPI